MGSVHRLFRRQRAGMGAVALPALAVLALALAPLVLAGCGSSATDANEPNDDLSTAHTLKPGTPVDGVIGSDDDSDVFRCEAPAGGGRHAFVVRVQTDHPQDIEMQVGASIPGVWEGITWPGWKAVTEGDRMEVAGELRKGTVLMFLKGSLGTVYTIGIAWE